MRQGNACEMHWKDRAPMSSTEALKKEWKNRNKNKNPESEKNARLLESQGLP
jgi:hypothetical protein